MNQLAVRSKSLFEVSCDVHLKAKMREVIEAGVLIKIWFAGGQGINISVHGRPENTKNGPGNRHLDSRTPGSSPTVPKPYDFTCV